MWSCRTKHCGRTRDVLACTACWGCLSVCVAINCVWTAAVTLWVWRSHTDTFDNTPCFAGDIYTTCTWTKAEMLIPSAVLVTQQLMQTAISETDQLILTQNCTFRCLISLLLGCFNPNFSSRMWSILISRSAALFILLNVAFPLRASTSCSAQGICMFCLLSLGCCSSVWLVCGGVCVSSFILLVRNNQL